MILVTVGTTMPFPTLLAEVDRLAGSGVFGERVVCQTGRSEIELRHCESFKFRPTLDDLMGEASLVITHGGSTVFSLLSQAKPFIAFPNPIGADQHQLHVLRSLAQQVNVLWSENVADLERLFTQAKSQPPALLNMPKLGDEIRRLLG